MLYVRLRDSLSNPNQQVRRLLAALEEHGGLGQLVPYGDTAESIIAQTGADDPASVRLQVKENRKLSPDEIDEVVARYEAGATIRSLSKEFGLHEQTVRAHLRRAGVTLRPVRALAEEQEAEAVRLYVEEHWTLAEVGAKFGVSLTAIRNALVRWGVERRERTS